MDTFWRWHGALQGNRVVENRFDSGEPKNRPWYFANNPCSRWSVRRLCLCIRLSHRCGLHKIIYIGLVCKHGAAPRKIAVKCNSHHRQGISPSADSKARIDFEKTCGTDRFWKGVPELPRVSAGVLIFIYTTWGTAGAAVFLSDERIVSPFAQILWKTLVMFRNAF